MRSKRGIEAGGVPEWEYLRSLASQIKTHTIANLGDYLEQFEQNATRLGATVHWAADADEHNRIVLDILRRHDTSRIAKSKSMLTLVPHYRRSTSPAWESNRQNSGR